jgi:hypothetical protein
MKERASTCRTWILAAVLLLAALAVPVWAQTPPACQQPVISVAPGLAPESEMLRILARRVNLTLDTRPTASADELDDKPYKTMIVILGASGKGLGSAGVSLDDEIDRAKKLIAQARKLGMTLIGLHIGGEDRRGPNTERMLPLVVPEMNLVIVRSDGNQDGVFTKLTAAKKIPLTSIDKTMELMDVLKKTFQLP